MTQAIPTIRFKSDAAMRRRYYPDVSFQHPAKLHCGVFLEILHRYNIKPGSVLLDPMAGSGTCLLAAQYGITVLANELESHFCKPMVEAWQKIQQAGPALGFTLGQVLILRGDARMLPLPDASIGGIASSTPYEASYTRWGNEQNDLMASKGLEGKYTRPPDVIVSSPPY